MANSGNLIELKANKAFNLDEINELMPIINRITRQYNERVQEYVQKIEALTNKNETAKAYEKEINALVQEWQIKIEKLGGITKGLWIADFDSSDGYFCWKYPEEKIYCWHEYKDGFSGRKPIQDYVNRIATEGTVESIHANRISPNQLPDRGI